jgi:hypothetical protein
MHMLLMEGFCPSHRGGVAMTVCCEIQGGPSSTLHAVWLCSEGLGAL